MKERAHTSATVWLRRGPVGVHRSININVASDPSVEGGVIELENAL